MPYDFDSTAESQYHVDFTTVIHSPILSPQESTTSGPLGGQVKWQVRIGGVVTSSNRSWGGRGLVHFSAD